MRSWNTGARRLWLHSGSISTPPDPQELAAALREALLEIHPLEVAQCPGKLLVVCGLMFDDDDVVLVRFLLECIENLVLHPLGGNRSGRKDEQEPVTSRKRLANFIVPLLGSKNVSFAIPVGNSVPLEEVSQGRGELAVL